MLKALKARLFPTTRLNKKIPLFFTVSVLAFFVCTYSSAIAAIMRVPGSPETAKKEAAKAVETPDPEKQREITTLALANARAEMKRKFMVPPGISREEVEERNLLLDRLVLRLNGKLNLIAEAKALRNARIAAERQMHDWAAVHKRQDYSVLEFDESKKTVTAARTKVHGLDSALKLFDPQLKHFRELVEIAGEKDRLAADRMQAAYSHEERQEASWRKELAGIRVRSAEAGLDWALTRNQVLAERYSIAQYELELLERKAAEARNRVLFSRADLNSALSSLKAARETLDKELESSLASEQSRISELARAQQALADSQTPQGAGHGGPGFEVLKSGEQSAMAWVESSRFRIEVVSALISINQSYSALWHKRYEAMVGTDSGKRRAILDEFGKISEKLQNWREFILRQLDVYTAAERKQDTRLAGLDEGSPIRQAVQAQRDALNLQKTQGERLYAALEQAGDDLQSWREDIEYLHRTRSFGERFRDWFDAALDTARRLWNYELFVVEDSLEVGGKKVVTSHGVTVGKSIGAILLLLAGYLAASFLGRRMRRIMIRRFGISGHQADLIRRGFVSLAIFVLLILTLNLARIPITVFAFLGGALAIGVGFGTQTLIKNLICGIIMLMERKVKVGDTVEVDGVQGTITSVDIRTSTVTGFDGIETVIPNATFLENKVTNWTHTNATLRRILRVGVAYGSPVERVSEIILECANRHGLVLKKPPPEVFFEEFADSSMNFALYFWIEYGPGANPLRVASDLRFMIEKRFAEEKIVIAFPQHDVHLDASAPFRVQLLTQNGVSIMPEGKCIQTGPVEVKMPPEK
ncbi:MAG: mechanosensitive ion channel [Deltaproteobacteria bacterium]|nr:mechanosensitive ion channel [Deltaproteobacteria bacterium]